MSLKSTTKIRPRPTRSQALEFFLSSIQDPHNPKHCGSCLDGAFLQCTGAPQWQPQQCEPEFKIPTQQLHNSELWNATVKFLFIPRSEKQLEELLGHLSECKCLLDQESEDLQQYHEISDTTRSTSNKRTYNQLIIEDAPEENKNFAVSWNSFFANLFLTLSVVIGRSSMRSSAKGVATFWPMRVTDLIPFGAEEFVQSVALWYFTVADPIIFRVTGAVLGVARELVIPSLIDSRFTWLVVELTSGLIKRVISNLLDLKLSKPIPPYTLSIFPWHTIDVIVYLQAILEGIGDDDVYKVHMFLNCETKTVQMCTLLLYTADVLRVYKDPPDFREELAAIGQEIFRFFSLHTPSRPPFPVHPVIQERDVEMFPPPDFWNTLRMTVLNTLRRLRFDTKCSAHGCLNSFQSVGKEFQRCGKCCLVPYCGRECQKKEWKHARYPHKIICPILQDLIDTAGGRTLFFSAMREVDKGIPGKASEMFADIFCDWHTLPILFKNDLELISEWETSVRKSKGYHWPLEENDLSPGYPDYEECVTFLNSLIRGPEPVYLEPLGRWPEEVARQLQLLMLQPFWGQEIDC